MRTSELTSFDVKSRDTGTTLTANVEDALDLSAIAELSEQQIPGLTRDELIRLIQASQLLFPESELGSQLDLCDRPSLERLAHLARRRCRHRVY